MRAKHTMTASVVAGKLALQMGAAFAEPIVKLASVASSTPTLDQVGYPSNILQAIESGGNDGKLGVVPIKAAVAAGKKPRIDFIVNQLDNTNNPIVVFLGYSTAQGTAAQWQDLGINLSLDRKSLHVIAAYKVNPNTPLDEYNGQASPLGSVVNNGNSLVIPVQLSDLSHAEFSKKTLFFQAVAVPLINNKLDFTKAAVTELDRYDIVNSNTTK